jgi:Na+/proline symporter
MCTYGVAFVPANLLFLSLGVLLVMLGEKGVADSLLPGFVERNGLSVLVPFTIGIVAASFSSADSALTSLTTSYCVDIRGKAGDEQLRKRAHLGMSILFVVMILLFRLLNSTSVIDAIYTICGYTYGPLLGLFAFGMFTKRMPCDRYVPYICIASPLACYAIDAIAWQLAGYRFGYELLMMNGAITFLALLVSSSANSPETPSAGYQTAS